MEVPLQQQKAADASAEQRKSNELIKLIRKLRWMGMEDEAEGLLKELARRHPTDVISVIAPTRETD